MNKQSKFTIKEIKYLLKQYPYMKSKGIYKTVTETIESCFAESDEETVTLAENIYFKGKSNISMQFEVYLSESQILRKLNALNKKILIEAVTKDRMKAFRTAYTKLQKELTR